MGVAALVLGICALILGIFGLGFPIGTICGIVGIIFGVIGRKQYPENAGLAAGGMVCSIIGTIFLCCSFSRARPASAEPRDWVRC